MLFLGRLTEEKGIDLLIESFLLVNQSMPDWRLDIYGEGNLKRNLVKMIAERNADNFIALHTSEPDVESLFMESSILAMPSRREPFGMVIIESYSFGVPVVAFDIPYGPAALIDSDTGVLVEPYDCQAFADAMLTLMENPGKRKALGQSAFERVKSYYTIDKVGARFEQLLCERST